MRHDETRDPCPHLQSMCVLSLVLMCTNGFIQFSLYTVPILCVVPISLSLSISLSFVLTDIISASTAAFSHN